MRVALSFGMAADLGIGRDFGDLLRIQILARIGGLCLNPCGQSDTQCQSRKARQNHSVIHLPVLFFRGLVPAPRRRHFAK